MTATVPFDFLRGVQGVDAGHHIGPVMAWDWEHDGVGADGHDHLVIAGELTGLHPGVEAHLDVGVLQGFADHIVLELLQGST